jgi:hypothetical protein
MAYADVTEIPGTDGVQKVFGANDRGEIMWLQGGDPGNIMLSSRTEAGYEHVQINATVPGQGSQYGAFGQNGDAIWLQYDGLYHYDAATGFAQRLTNYPIVSSWYPRYTQSYIAGNGNAAWPLIYPRCGWCSGDSSHIDYFDKTAGVVSRLTAAPNAAHTVAMTARGDAYWIELAADKALLIRRYDPATQDTTTVVQRPVGTAFIAGDRETLAVNDSGDIAWIERSAGTSQQDIFAYDQRSGTVKRITETPVAETGLKTNAVGDIVWRTDSQLWLYDHRNQASVMISGQSIYNSEYSLDDLGNVAWTYSQEPITKVHYYTRATSTDVTVRPDLSYGKEGDPKLNAAGEIFFVSRSQNGYVQKRIVHATRSFLCN